MEFSALSSVSSIASQMISLFLMMFAGFLAAKTQLISPEIRRKLSALVLNIACPCIILSSVLESGGQPEDMLSALCAALVFYAVMIALGFLLVKLFRTPKDEQHLDQLMLVLTNLAFMGIPIIKGLYGAMGVAMLSMFILIFNFLVFTYGVFLVSGGRGMKPRQLLNTGVFSSLLALFFGLTGFHLPGPVESALSSLGATTTPLSMMIIGASVAHSDIRAAFSKPRIYRVTALRLLLMPALLLAIMKLLPFSPLLSGIAVLVAAMPIAGNCGMLSDVYLPDDPTASHAIVVTTLLSGLTLPLVVLAMGLFGL